MRVGITSESLLLFSLVITAATTTTTATSSSAAHKRRLLHQPFSPLSAAAPPTHPPSLPPQPQTQPKYQSSTTPETQQKPFFPHFPSLPPPPSSPPPPPPPPSVSSLATFPANISSLLFPHPPPSSISRRHHHHLIITISISLSILFATILAALYGIFLYSHCRHYHHHTATISEKTSYRSDSLRLFPPSAIQSDGSPKPPKLPRHPGVSNTSSEFLYMGTLANSRNGLEDHQKATNLSNAGITIGVSSPAYQKLGSPELRPLPPLPRHNYTPSYRSGEVLLGPSKEGEADIETDDEGEQFFSPRGSSGQKECLPESQLPIGSSSRRELQGLQGENFGSTSFNSRTASYPYSNSVSPANSVSTSPSAVTSSSVMSLKSKSQNSTQFKVGVLGQNEQSTTRFESIVGVTNPFVPTRFRDISSGVARDLNWMSSGPPMLIMPSKPFLVQNGESSLTCDQFQPSSSVERSQETPKPKLNPLHWDKVGGS